MSSEAELIAGPMFTGFDHGPKFWADATPTINSEVITISRIVFIGNPPFAGSATVEHVDS
jgi:hypothetical protein